MPVNRKTFQPPPSFSFVTFGPEVKYVDWRKVHVGSVRRHAAYWAGPAKYRYVGNKDNISTWGDSSDTNGCHHQPLGSCPCSTAQATHAKRSPRSKMRRTVGVIKIPRVPAVNYLHHLFLSYPAILTTTEPPFRNGSYLLSFLGNAFVQRFFQTAHKDNSLMLSGYLLLSYAHYMALTGRGKTMVLLELKNRAIQCVSLNMRRAAKTPLSPQSLVVMLALAAPVVCLVSQDLPQRLSVWDYILVSMTDSWLCCIESAAIAHNSMAERTVHRKAISALISKIPTESLDSDSIALLQYISNYMDLSMVLDAAVRPSTSLTDVDALFPAMKECGQDCHVSNPWFSPLTCSKRLNPTDSLKNAEKQISQLADLVQEWFMSFFGANGHILYNNSDQTLEHRKVLRSTIEQFSPGSTMTDLLPEEQAMYECCRWASLIVMEVEQYGVPIHIAAERVRIQPRLIRCLRMTDLGGLWGNYRGLLFWVAVTCHLSVAGQCFPLLTTTLLTKFAHELALSNACFEIALKPLWRLKQFETFCCRTGFASQSLVSSK